MYQAKIKLIIKYKFYIIYTMTPIIHDLGQCINTKFYTFASQNKINNRT